MKVLNLEKTARSSSKVTNAKTKMYRFIAAMMAFTLNGIVLNKSAALNPKELVKFLAEWKKVSKDASLEHILTIEGVVLDEFNLLKDVFIDEQVNFKRAAFASVEGFITDKEQETLDTAIESYRGYIIGEVDRMTRRIELATPKPVVASKPKKKAEKVTA